MLTLSESLNTTQIQVDYFLAVAHSGPAIIKLAQWTATRRDIFPSDCCDRLSHLQRKTSTRSLYLTEHILCDIFGRNWEMLFEHFDTVPVGSGCIAQVLLFYFRFY
jgi:aarF domain-containing kinase